MRYCLDKNKFKQRLLKLNYKSLSDFASKQGMHRNTLHALLNGKDVFSTAFKNLARSLQIDPMELLESRAEIKNNIQDISLISPMVATLIKQDSKMAVMLLGSRANGRAKKYSDWDLGIVRYPHAFSAREFFSLKRMIEDMTENRALTIDIVNLNLAPDWFLGNIRQTTLFLDGDQQSYIYFKGVLDGIQKNQTDSCLQPT